jgi:hypothetical protein
MLGSYWKASNLNPEFRIPEIRKQPERRMSHYEREAFGEFTAAFASAAIL